MCLGGGDCDPGESHENDVIVFGRSEGRRERVVLDILPYSSYRVREIGYVTQNICPLSSITIEHSIDIFDLFEVIGLELKLLDY